MIPHSIPRLWLGRVVLLAAFVINLYALPWREGTAHRTKLGDDSVSAQDGRRGLQNDRQSQAHPGDRRDRQGW
jgi:hypothetical protein